MDDYPQYFLVETGLSAVSANNACHVVNGPIAMPPVPTTYCSGSAGSIILELDFVEYDMVYAPLMEEDNINRVYFGLASEDVPDVLANDWSATRGIFYKFEDTNETVTQGTPGANAALAYVVHHEVTGKYIFSNNDGFGLLYPGNQMYAFAGANGIQDGTRIRVLFKVWYRYVSIPLAEYIGLVTSWAQ